MEDDLAGNYHKDGQPPFLRANLIWMGSTDEMIVPEKLSELYGVRAKIVEAEGRRIILWGK
jgi:ABC-type cobalamin transport system ATPase subunit